MKNNTKKVLLATILGLFISGAVSASEEDYDITGYDAPAVSIVHQGGPQPLYDGSEADSFTYNSSAYSAVGVHKASFSEDKMTNN